ncbi:hypothetical protein N7454_004957 [Penicillium verhagenii]|nr:hypothetical protein N7454_004957 [Penicillium verhagenii]
MASLAPDSCCYKGVKHKGVAKGALTHIAGTEAYTVYPESQSTEKAILILTDILGHKLINTQLIADQFAANGYFVVIPDLFEGDPIPLNRPGDFDMEKWRSGGYDPKGTAHFPPNVDPIVDSCLTAMRDTFGCKTIGGVGYCFGANKFPPEKRHTSEGILQKTGLPYQINLYSGVNHGFAVRGDLSNRVVKYAKETAFLQAVLWFNEHL